MKCPRCGRPLYRNGKTPGGRQRWRCTARGRNGAHCYSTTSPAGGERNQRGDEKKPAEKKVFTRKLTRSRFVVTAAQNATPVHKGFLKSLKVYCEAMNAELLVIPLRYKNPTSRWTESQANEEVWADELQPYLFNRRRKLNPNITVLGDVKTQPTAISPLSGYEALTHGESGILGHTKLQLRSIPTPQSRMPKLLTTTGAVTVPNYTDSKAGKLGEFHHTLGAALVEIEGKTFHLRQINASKRTGSFYDLDRFFDSEGCGIAAEAEAPVMGDTHVDFVDPAVRAATFGKGGIIETTHPRVLVYHDLLDGYAVNPWHVSDPLKRVAKTRANRASARDEVIRALRFVQDFAKHAPLSIVVSSNHNDFLRRWILGTDWRSDPLNAQFYLETALAMVAATRLTNRGVEYPNAFVHWAQAVLSGPQFKVLEPDESHMIGDIEVGMHGDAGPNGARGSVRNLRRIGVKSIIGHSHSPAIDEGCYQVGTSTELRLDYCNGPSSWLNTHCLVYPNGKRTLLNIIDGKWRI